MLRQSFAHGANDTANATSAFSAVYEAYTTGLDACALGETPWWIMSVAGAFVGLGLATLGYKVIQTVGNPHMLEGRPRRRRLHLSLPVSVGRIRTESYGIVCCSGHPTAPRPWS